MSDFCDLGKIATPETNCPKSCPNSFEWAALDLHEIKVEGIFMRVLMVGVTFWCLVMGHAVLGEEKSNSPEAIKAGDKLFSLNCMVCHGPKGAGDGPASSGLNPKPRNLTSDPFKRGDSSEQIFDTISNGLTGTAMVAFPQLTVEQRKNIVAFIRSLRDKK